MTIITPHKGSFFKTSVFLILFIVLNLSGCVYWQDNLATIVILFGGEGRAAGYPPDRETFQKLEHEVILTSAAETLNFSFKGKTTFETSVAPGKWNVAVNSYLDGEIYATGSKDVILKLGRNNETIEMRQAICWWTWDASTDQAGITYDSTTRVTITPTDDNSGCDVTVAGTANHEDENWASQTGRNYIAAVGKTYRVTWKWKADNKPFQNVTIRYAQEVQQDGIGDEYYELGTYKNKLTIPVNEEAKSYEFTMPGNCFMSFAFMIGGDTGSFTIRDFKVEEVKLLSSIKERITFSRGRGDEDVSDEKKPYDNWVGSYDIPAEVRGEGIKTGEVFTFTYTFTSDTDIRRTYNSDGEEVGGGLSIILLDNSGTAVPKWWKELSEYNNFIPYIQANKPVSDTITFTAIRNTSSSEVDANRLVFLIDPVDAVDERPTLTFTKFEFKKAEADQ